MAVSAFNQRIREVLEMPRSLPNRGIRKDCRIKAHDICALVDVIFPPRALDVVPQFRTERTVIPDPIEPTIDFTALENEPAALAKRY